MEYLEKKKSCNNTDVPVGQYTKGKKPFTEGFYITYRKYQK